jgi:hypothetical protein
MLRERQRGTLTALDLHDQKVPDVVQKILTELPQIITEFVQLIDEREAPPRILLEDGCGEVEENLSIGDPEHG